MTDNRRNQLIEVVEREFIGPDPIDWDGLRQENGEEILVSDPPFIRYIAGILYPPETVEEDISSNSEVAEPEWQVDTEDTLMENNSSRTVNKSEFLQEAEEFINQSNAYHQSAMSLTVAIKEGDEIILNVSAATYIKTPMPQDFGKYKKYKYLRAPLFWNNNGEAINLSDSENRIHSIDIDGSGLYAYVTYRYKKGADVIYTITLSNTKEKSEDNNFYQVKFKLESKLGFSPIAESQRITADEDYKSNQLLYRDVHNYAIGHGCSAEWDDNADTINWISTAVFPKHEIKPIVPSKIDGVSLDMIKMSPLGNFDESIQELQLMCLKYREWINSLKIQKQTLSAIYLDTAQKHIDNCEECLSRMEDGIKILASNEKVKIAFQYMNLAMVMQQLHYNLPLRRWESFGASGLKLNNPNINPVVTDPDTWSGDKNRYGKWRPFQLAFILMNLKSMYDKDCNEREIVDLIWFPTGGGKTEAYLGLSAYTIFIRKLLNSEDKGTAILMRYTLRLLTAQQYERAAAMICSCEYIRSQNESLFGKNRISIGLWVGEGTTPNKMADAVKKFDGFSKGEKDNPFVILKCPWCGAEMGPVQNGKIQEVKGYRKTKGKHGKFKISYRCSNVENHCHYSTTDLPLYIIDESIYEETPTLLLGTVDKFAMLPFRPEAQSIFGFKNGTKVSTPDLIIQDELHLISGPLGSMVGHYETLISELCTFRTSSREIKPKIIASTATISRAKEQCNALYGCGKENVFQFPPSGLDAGYSFFAEEDKTANGRLYVGILAAGSSSDATTAIRLYSSLLYGAKALKVSSEEERDPYWTNVGYFNSIRELGQASTWIRADIDQHLDVMYKRRHDHERTTIEEYRNNRRYIYRDEELTSRISGSEVTSSLSNLSITYPPVKNSDGKMQNRPIDICLATNMISVGLDVPRLGLMTVAGQPKTTSEYIQATSRVGRDAKKAPGVVFVLYRPGRPRDKSHYEQFKSYHSRIYCNVEPTSVTPFSSPVRKRALHAIMIGLLRLQGNESYNQDPPKFPNDELLSYVENIIANRVEDIDKDEYENTIRNIEDIIKKWKNWNPEKWVAAYNKDLSYADPVPLMYYAGSHPNDYWLEKGMETPTSMRSVDASCEAAVIPNEYVILEE